MPIKFRCPNCRQFLGISRSKAGTLSDCPTCGRTLRVPALDGTLAPLPDPKLNLEDSGLREALGALARLDDDGDPESLEEFAQFEQPPLEQSPEEFVPDIDHPIIVVEPIVPSAPGIDAAPETPVSKDNQLEELASLGLAMPIVEDKFDTTRNRLSQLFLWLFVAVAIVAAFFTGRLSSTESVSPHLSDHLVDDKEHDLADGPEIDDDNPAPRVASLSGRLTYVSGSGDIRPDKGARILVLPQKHPGQSMLPGNGFRVGAASVDQNVLQAAATALGGGFTFADSDGKYQISELDSGEYTVLIESTYQPRDDSQPLRPEVSNFLQQYFEHPSRVLGQIQHVYQEIELTLDEKSKLNYEFRK